MMPLADPGTSCAPMGYLEYVVESQRRGKLQRWFVLRPHEDLADRYAAAGLSLLPGCRVVVDADSMRPLGILASEVARPPSPAARPSQDSPG